MINRIQLSSNAKWTINKMIFAYQNHTKQKEEEERMGYCR
jgi:hypothetical protein